MGQSVKVTESKFNAIKLLLKGGATLDECAKYMDVSSSTVSIIKKSDTYEEYKQNCYMTSSAYRNKMAAIKAKEEKAKEEQAKEEAAPVEPVTKVIHEQSVTIQATHYMMEEMKKTNELLKLISSKLAFIVDELTK